MESEKLLQFESFNPENEPVSDVDASHTERPRGDFILPFGILQGMLTPLPDDERYDGDPLMKTSSIYQTVTDNNDRQGDRED